MRQKLPGDQAAHRPFPGRLTPLPALRPQGPPSPPPSLPLLPTSDPWGLTALDLTLHTSLALAQTNPVLQPQAMGPSVSSTGVAHLQDKHQALQLVSGCHWLKFSSVASCWWDPIFLCNRGTAGGRSPGAPGHTDARHRVPLSNLLTALLSFPVTLPAGSEV